MGERDQLPILGQEPAEVTDEESPSCSPTAYVSNEESGLLLAMRTVKKRASVVREALDQDQTPEARDGLEAELDKLRKKFWELSQRRERAYLRKMVMLGHLPPSVLDD
jgi:hypothetical protein